MEYFDLNSIQLYSEAVGQEYDSDDKATKWYFNTREKLKHLVKLLSKELGENFKINYTEKPNKQAGQGMGFVLKEYVLIGFIPERLKFVGKEIFIKPSFSHFKNSEAVFSLDLDVNFKNEKNPYKRDRQSLLDKTSWKIPVDKSFPESWVQLLDIVKPKVEEIIFILNDYLVEQASNIVAEDQERYISLSNSKKRKPMNQILFGPPGTGKTYNTINKALEIIGESIEGKTRKEIKDLFDAKMKEGQIVFTTFHQSMSYEDFIEGIKPQKPLQTDTYVRYDIQNGIFKTICQSALTPNQVDFDISYDKLKEELSKSELIQLKTPTGKDFSISLNSNDNLTLHTGPTKEKQGTLTKENIQKQINGEVKFKGWEGYFKGVLEYLKANYGYSETEKTGDKNYVLIIDEINRGNVSQIFGELITLIEENKRLGKDEALSVILPYSKEVFGVPSNLYIIGTMNTADRSVEALDAALRRRFSFEEIMPRAELITSSETLRNFWLNSIDKYGGSKESYDTYEKDIRAFLGIEILDHDKYISYGDDEKSTYTKVEFENKLKGIVNFNGINLSVLLSTINIRIEKLLDKDHQIGHSYFMTVFSWIDLQNAFYNKIIPLLQEYFFGDYDKIGLVLGQGFIELKEWDKNDDSFADFNSESASDYNDKQVYTIIDYRNSNHGFKLKNKKNEDIKMNFEKAVKLILKQEIE